MPPEACGPALEIVTLALTLVLALRVLGWFEHRGVRRKRCRAKHAAVARAQQATGADLMDEPPACPKVGAERMARMFGGVNRG